MSSRPDSAQNKADIPIDILGLQTRNTGGNNRRNITARIQAAGNLNGNSSAICKVGDMGKKRRAKMLRCKHPTGFGGRSKWKTCWRLGVNGEINKYVAFQQE